MGERKWFVSQKQSIGETLTILLVALLGGGYLGGIIGAIVAAIVLTILFNYWKSGVDSGSR